MKTNSLQRLIVSMIACMQAGLAAHAATIVTNTFNASTTWQVPAGVTSVDVYTWGGGGGSGGSTNSGASARVAGGGGGAGGAFAGTLAVSVTAGELYSVNVGGGGTAGVGGVAGTAGTGGNSYFSNNVPSGLKVLAQGGAGGGNGTIAGTTPSQGAGGIGSTSSSTGTTLFVGGSGATAINPSGGAGGGGAGSAGPGGNGVGTTAGAGGTPDGGIGGAGRVNANPGAVGTAPGGAAGGAKVGNTVTGTQPGAAGGAGRVTLVYTIPFNTLSWIGDGVNNFWSTNSGNTCWDSDLDNVADVGFTDGDVLTFGNAGAANTAIAIETRVAPTTITVTDPVNYSFTSNGWISGVTTLTKSSTGILTIGTTNDYTGVTTISGGTIRVGTDSALGGGRISIGGGALTSTGSTPRTFTNLLVVTGASTLGDVTDNGPLTFGNTLNFNGANRAVTINSDVLFASGSTNGQVGTKSGPATLTLKGTFIYAGSSDVTEGLEILDGATLTNSDRLIPDASSGRLARLVITNGAKVYSTGTVNNMRSGRAGAADGTNILQLAGVYRTDNAIDPNGYATVYLGCAWSEIDFLSGGDYAGFGVKTSGTGSGYTLVVFDGGIMRARANNATFMEGLSEVSVRAGGAKIDDGGFAITINQSLQDGGGGGGLTKIGSGSLTLGATNTYTGNTVVSNGTLAVVTGGLTGGGGLLVRDGAKLIVTDAGSSLTVSSLTLGSAGASTLQFSFPSGNPGSAMLSASSVTANGPATINIGGAAFAPGIITLIQSSSAISGLTNFVLGSKPAGMSATLVTNANSIGLNITAAISGLLWTGSTDANWNTTSTNWFNLNTSASTAYSQGDLVTFDNTGAQPNVNLALAVTPLFVTVNSGSYNFVGAGKLSGSAGLTVNNGAVVTLGTVNDYSGGTTNNGQLVAGTNQALGSGTVVLNTGSQLRSDSGTARSLTNTFMVTADDINLGDVGNTGTLTLSGINLGGSTTRALNAQSDVVIASSLTNGVWKTKNGPGTIVVKASYTQSALFIHNQGDVIIDGAYFDNGNGWRIMNTSGGTSRLVVTNGGTMAMTAVTTGNFRVGNAGGDNTTATNILDVSGTINLLTSSGVVNNSAVIVGDSGVSAILNLRSPGNLKVRAITGSTPANTEAHFYGGTLTALATDAAFINGLTNAWLETGGLTIDSVTNTVTVPQLLSGSGGLIKIGTGRLVLDGANTYTGTTLVSQGILGGNGVISGPVTVASGATLAPGATTTIGTLSITNNLTLSNGSTVSVQVNKDDLTKDLVTGLTNVTYSGTLLVTNIGANALAGGDSFQLFSASGTRSGNLAVVIQNTTGVTNGTFNPATGTLTIGSTIPTTPTNLTYSVSGGVITLQWPPNYLGWSLQTQTNPPGLGLGTNWVTIPGTASVTSTNLAISPANGSVFYRMSYQP